MMAKLKFCPNCRKSGKSMIIWHAIGRPVKKCHIECPNYHCAGKAMPFPWLARLAWNLQRRGGRG